MTSARLFGFREYLLSAVGVFGLVVILLIAALMELPHEATPLFSLYRQLMLLFLGIIAMFLWRAEMSGRNKIVFALFAVLGIQQVLDIAYFFAPILFPGERFAGFFYFQYVTAGLGLVIQGTCIVGAGVLMNTQMRVSRALAMIFVPAVVLFLSVYWPMIENPRYLYTTPDVTDFRIVDRAWMELYGQTQTHPEPSLVAERVGLSRWDGQKRVGELTHEEEVQRIAELEPYLFGSNYNLLVFKPLNVMWWKGNLIAGALILCLILYWFVGESPRGVYFERITILLLCFSIFEVFHFSIYAGLKDNAAYIRYFNIGALLSLLTVFGLIVLFVLRLRFALSLEGRYYESRLASEPVKITRWRDALDNYIIGRLFRENPFKNRFVVKDPPGSSP
ncbi:MAG: hypothetical protein HBSIN02_05960 [Bacteroidia bacterium]|nr:MAG: hypothetical protein HBSIN02_05960 [Bacteroidia bacterium]